VDNYAYNNLAARRLALAIREGVVLPWPSFFMYLLYLDHAGAIEDPGQHHFVLAGISVFERQTYWLAQQLEQIAARFNPADPFSIELHGSPMHGGRSEWRKFPVLDENFLSWIECVQFPTHWQ
jgi:hypothetical protein